MKEKCKKKITSMVNYDTRSWKPPGRSQRLIQTAGNLISCDGQHCSASMVMTVLARDSGRWTSSDTPCDFLLGWIDVDVIIKNKKQYFTE